MTYQTTNPATGKVMQEFPGASDVGLEAVLSTAHACHQTDWRHRSVKDRATVMRAAVTRLRADKERLAQLLTLEMGKLIAEARAEVDLSADILDYYATHAERYLQSQALVETVVETRPIGIIFGVEPWNLPYYQLARVAGPQLMVGNVVMIKRAENVPQSALAFARVFEEAGAPNGAHTNIFADYDQAGRVIDDPRVRGATVTGSERAGVAVAEAR